MKNKESLVFSLAATVVACVTFLASPMNAQNAPPLAKQSLRSQLAKMRLRFKEHWRIYYEW